jgi:2,3,4,5-tetrahydropyridine-2-carboxylate N-succinyltransferase
MTAMSQAELARTIDEAFDRRDGIEPTTKGEVREAVDAALDLLDRGNVRVAEKGANGDWRVNQWLKKAVLLSFRLNDMSVIEGGPGKAVWWDKIVSKFDGWTEVRFREAGLRAVPNCIVRRSAYIAPGVVLMPSFVNLGAYVDRGTMVDTWATVGSCAQIGKNCHISGGAGIGGVLEPLQAGPVIIEDNCFVGARSEVAEGVIRLNPHRRPRDWRDPAGRGAGLFGRGAGLAAGQARQERRAEPEPLLRGDRQARRREDAGENLDQRVVAGLKWPPPTLSRWRAICCAAPR